MRISGRNKRKMNYSSTASTPPCNTRETEQLYGSDTPVSARPLDFSPPSLLVAKVHASNFLSGPTETSNVHTQARARAHTHTHEGGWVERGRFREWKWRGQTADKHSHSAKATRLRRAYDVPSGQANPLLRTRATLAERDGDSDVAAPVRPVRVLPRTSPFSSFFFFLSFFPSPPPLYSLFSSRNFSNASRIEVGPTSDCIIDLMRRVNCISTGERYWILKASWMDSIPRSGKRNCFLGIQRFSISVL